MMLTTEINTVPALSWLVFQLHIRKAPGSDLGPETDYPENNLFMSSIRALKLFSVNEPFTW
jgi:hypothetical protein